MARRRLTPPVSAPASATPGAGSASGPLETKSALPRIGPKPSASAPIAKIAGEAAAAGAEALRAAQARAAADRAAAARLEEAESEGRVLRDIPLDAIIETHLERDRAAPPRAGARAGRTGEADETDEADEEMQALILSLRTHGQRTPAEVVALPPLEADPLDADLDDPARAAQPRYGLISGWRRLSALKALHAQTGDPRFSRLRAILRAPATAAEAYAAMVEENEIRQGLSYYERGRIAVLAAARGAFADAGEAVNGLFAAASKAKRSKIRAFVRIHEELGADLRHAVHLSEREGLRIAEALRAGRGDELRAALAAADPARGPAAERALLAALSARPSQSGAGAGAQSGVQSGAGAGSSGASAPEVSHAKPALKLRRTGREVGLSRREIAPGLNLELRGEVTRGGGHAVLRFSGPGLDAEILQAALDAAAEIGARRAAGGKGGGKGG